MELILGSPDRPHALWVGGPRVSPTPGGSTAYDSYECNYPARARTSPTLLDRAVPAQEEKIRAASPRKRKNAPRASPCYQATTHAKKALRREPAGYPRLLRSSVWLHRSHRIRHVASSSSLYLCRL